MNEGDGSAMDAGGEVYLIYDDFMEEVRPLLKEFDALSGASPADKKAGAESLASRARAIIARAVRTGAILDGFEERRDFQKETDYLATLLERMEFDPGEVTLAPFDAKACSLIPLPPFPFDDLLKRQSSQPPGGDEVKHYLLDKCRTAKLRFESGLVDEFGAQLTGDREAWPLLWSCLRNLYAEQAGQGLGNKLHRPKTATGFDSRSFLVDRGKRAYEEFPEDSKAALRRTLVELALKSGVRGDAPTGLSRQRLDSLARTKASAVREQLDRHYLVWAMDSEAGGERLRLVHRALFERWGDLHGWVEADLSRRRQRWALIGVVGAAVVVLLVISSIVYSYFAGQSKLDAESRAIALRSLDLLAYDGDLALVTALEAECVGGTDLAWESVARALDRPREPLRFSPSETDRALVVPAYVGGKPRVLTVGDNGAVKVWDVAGNTSVSSNENPFPNPTLFAVSARAPVAAVARQAPPSSWEVQLWDVETGRRNGEPITAQSGVSALALSTDGKQLAIAGQDGAVHVYANGMERSPAHKTSGYAPSQLAFSPDGELLAAGGATKAGGTKVTVWWLDDSRKPLALPLPRGGYGLLAIGFPGPGSNPGQADKLVTVGEEFEHGVQVESWNLHSGTGVPKKLPFAGMVSSVLDAEGRQVLLVGAEGTVRVYDTVLGRETLTVPVSANTWGLRGIFSPDGQEVAIKNIDSTVRINPVNKAAESYEEDLVFSAAFTADGKRLAIGTDNGSVKIIDVEPDGTTGGVSARFQAPPVTGHSKNAVQSVEFDPSGSHVLAVLSDNTAAIWSIPHDSQGANTHQSPVTLNVGEGAACAHFSPNGSRVVTTSINGLVQAWNADGSTTQGLPIDSGAPSGRQSVCAVFTGDKDHVMALDKSGQVRKWTVGSPGSQPSAQGSEPKTKFGRIAVSPDGQEIAAEPVQFGGSVVLFDNKKRTSAELSGAIKVGNFTSDGRRIATVDWDGGVSVWEIKTYRRVVPFAREEPRSLVVLRGDGTEVFIASGNVWVIQHCAACGSLEGGDVQKKLRTQGYGILARMSPARLSADQFSCLAKQGRLPKP